MLKTGKELKLRAHYDFSGGERGESAKRYVRELMRLQKTGSDGGAV